MPRKMKAKEGHVDMCCWWQLEWNEGKSLKVLHKKIRENRFSQTLSEFQEHECLTYWEEKNKWICDWLIHIGEQCIIWLKQSWGEKLEEVMPCIFHNWLAPHALIKIQEQADNYSSRITTQEEVIHFWFWGLNLTFLQLPLYQILRVNLAKLHFIMLIWFHHVITSCQFKYIPTLTHQFFNWEVPVYWNRYILGFRTCRKFMLGSENDLVIFLMTWQKAKKQFC